MSQKTVVSVFGLTPHRIGSGEAYARELSEQLAQRGWKSVLCFAATPPDHVREYLQAPNVSFEAIPNVWQTNRETTSALYSILKRHRPRILHLQYTGFISTFPWLARIAGVEKVYFTDQGSPPEDYRAATSPLWKRAATRIINHPLTGVVSVSQFVYKTFTARGLLPDDRFHLIYNSVDIANAQRGQASGSEFRERFKIPADALVVTQVSWLIPEKGIADFLVAAKDVVAAEPRAHFVLAGGGSQAKTFEQQAASLGISSSVTFTGVVSNPLAEGLFAASDVVCQMSRWQEAFGYVIAEAMATGKPMVGTRVGGIPELIEDGKTGFIVDRRDTKAMAEKIIELLRDPELRRRMGDAGRLAAAEKFNHKTNCIQLLELYGI